MSLKQYSMNESQSYTKISDKYRSSIITLEDFGQIGIKFSNSIWFLENVPWANRYQKKPICSGPRRMSLW